MPLPSTFRRKNFSILLGALIAINVGYISLGIRIASAESGFVGAVFLSVGFLLFTVLGAIAVLGASEIALDETGISRRLFGRTWQAIRWENVQRIFQYWAPDIELGRPIRIFFVYPAGKAYRGFLVRGRMNFNERFVDFETLLTLLNSYVKKYGIKVEIQQDSATRTTLTL